MTEGLLEACIKEDPALIASAIKLQEFTLIDNSDEESDEASALVAEVDEFPALVGFTSKEHVVTFAENVEEEFGDDDELSVFMVGGSDFLEYLPEDFGILINPESEDCFVLPPALVLKIKSEIGSIQ